jgi:hypothetical protein
MIKVSKKVEVKREKVNPMKIKEERKNLADSLTDELEQNGAIFFKPVEMGGNLNIDSDYLTLPKDLTETPSKMIGAYLNAFTQQRMYYRTLIGWQELNMEDAKRDYYDVSTPEYEELSKQKLSETAKDRILNNLKSVKPFFITYKNEKKKLMLFSYSLASIDDAIFLISREISRRGGDFNTEGRNESVQRR